MIPARCVAHPGRSVVEDRQVEPAEPLGLGEEVDLALRGDTVALEEGQDRFGDLGPAVVEDQ